MLLCKEVLQAHMSRPVCLIWLISILLTPWVGAQSRSTNEHITIAAEPDYPPYSFVDDEGVPQGFSLDLFRAVAEIMDIELETRSGLWDDIRNDLSAGRIDALPLVGRTPEREEHFDFTVPYISLLGGIVVSDDDSTIDELDDLRGKRIAVMAGDNAEEFLRRNGFDDEITTVPVFSEAIQRVADGKSDAVVMQRLVALRLIEEEGIGGVRVVEKPVREFRQDFCFAVTEGDKELLALLNDGLAIAIANGTLRQLRTKWFARSALRTQTIIIGGDKNDPPFEFIGNAGNPQGYNVDIVRAVAAELGLDVEIRLGNWHEIVEMLENGEIDAIQGMPYSVERDEVFDFSPLHTIRRYAAVARGNVPGELPGSIDDLRGSRIAVKSGDIAHQLIESSAVAATVIPENSDEDALRLVIEGTADYAVVSRFGALQSITDNGWDDLIVGHQDLFSRDYGFAVREGEDDLLSLLTEGLAIIEDNGTYREIYNRWLGIHKPQTMTFWELVRYTAVFLAPLLIVTLGIFAWNRSLKRQVLSRTTALEESERKYRLLAENTIDVVWLVTPRLRIWYVNPAIRILTGYPPERWVGGRIRDHLDATEFRKIVSTAFTLLEGGTKGAVFTVETRFKRRDGDAVEVEIVGKPLYAKDGSLDGFQGVARDVTDRKRYEAALHNDMQRKQWLTTIATAYLSRDDTLDLIKSTVEQLGDYFRQRDVICFVAARDGLFREEYRYDFSSNGADPTAPIDISTFPNFKQALNRRETLAIGNVSDEFRDHGGSTELLSMGIAAIAMVPVSSTGHPRRILAFTAAHPVEWSEHEILSLEEHANLLRLILDNEQYQRMMEDARRSIEKSLVEKQTLLQEIHHRVKNNLNVVISLLRLQENAIHSVDQARVAFQESQNRIYSMALVHESLYRSEDLSEIDLAEYLRDLTETLVTAVDRGRSVDLRFHLEPVHMNIGEAVPCGIIVNELVTNAIKHAFNGQDYPVIEITLRDERGSTYITIRDNGTGIPVELMNSPRSSLGLTLVHLLTDQIDGEIEISTNGGTLFSLRLPKRRGEEDKASEVG